VRAVALVLAAVLLALAACGGGGGDPAHAAAWNGPEPGFPEGGSFDVEAFRAHAAAVDEPWDADPEATARAFLDVDDGRTTVDGARVTIVRDSLEDDSVEALRYVVDLERDGDGWTVAAARWEQRCHAGRGHRDFSPELCI
jgi:hypothetical protein